MYDLTFLVAELGAAKFNEDFAKDERIAIEEKIAALIETKEVGQKTVTLENGMKVTVKRGLNYKADIAKIYAVFDDTPFQPPVKLETKHSLDTRGYEWYKGNNQAMFDVLSKHVTVTPKKVAVTLQESKG